MPLLVTAFLRTVVKLLKYELQLFRDRQPQVRCVLRQGHTLIGQIEKDHRCSKHAAGTDDLGVDSVADSDK